MARMNRSGSCRCPPLVSASQCDAAYVYTDALRHLTSSCFFQSDAGCIETQPLNSRTGARRWVLHARLCPAIINRPAQTCVGTEETAQRELFERHPFQRVMIGRTPALSLTATWCIRSFEQGYALLQRWPRTFEFHLCESCHAYLTSPPCPWYRNFTGTLLCEHPGQTSRLFRSECRNTSQVRGKIHRPSAAFLRLLARL